MPTEAILYMCRLVYLTIFGLKLSINGMVLVTLSCDTGKAPSRLHLYIHPYCSKEMYSLLYIGHIRWAVYIGTNTHTTNYYCNITKLAEFKIFPAMEWCLYQNGLNVHGAHTVTVVIRRDTLLPRTHAQRDKAIRLSVVCLSVCLSVCLLSP